MTERLYKLASLVKPCSVFADVGCDHGYISEAVLEQGLANFVVATDISAPSLEKCKSRLAKHENKFSTYVTDGLKGVKEKPEQVLIAGMGGKEIISILSDYEFAERLILQPMKNAPEVREYLFENCYLIERDFTFFSLSKKYDVIVCVKNHDGNEFLESVEKFYSKNDYAADELLFGKENVPARGEFKSYLKKCLIELSAAYSEVKDETQKSKIESNIEKIKRVIK